MTKASPESGLQNYLTRHNGLNLKKIDSSLELIESEHIFRGGRIDILAEKNSIPIGLELKYNQYNTRGICAQLLNYLNYMQKRGGEVYFIAPKIKYGIYGTLKEFYENKKLRFFEVTKHKEEYFFKEVDLAEIMDSKHTNLRKNYSGEQTPDEYSEKIVKGISLIVKDKKKARLINSIIDDRKSKQKQLEDIAESLIDILATKNSNFIKTTYELLKLL